MALPEFEQMLLETLEAIRSDQVHQPPRRRPLWNRMVLYAWPTIELERGGGPRPGRAQLARRRAAGDRDGAPLRPDARRRRCAAAAGAALLQPDRERGRGRGRRSPTQPLRRWTSRGSALLAARRRGNLHPAEIVKLLAPAPRTPRPISHRGSSSSTTSTRPAGWRRSSARRRTNTDRDRRRADPQLHRALPRGDAAGGPVRRPDTGARVARRAGVQRIIAALDLAEELGVPVEWFALSAGAKIAMDSGTENMDWIAAVLRRIVEFTQAGGELNVVITGINVGAQPYWNAEATMLMHTRGHPRDDPRQRDGADRQAGARLLRRRLGRGQLRHRRLRADHGSQRPSPVLGAPTSPAPAACCSRTTTTPTWRRASASRAGRRATTRSIATCASRRTRLPAPTSSGSARSSPTPPTRTASSPSTCAR